MGKNHSSSVRGADKGKWREGKGKGDDEEEQTVREVAAEVYRWTWLYCGCEEGWFTCCLALQSRKSF